MPFPVAQGTNVGAPYILQGSANFGVIPSAIQLVDNAKNDSR